MNRNSKDNSAFSRVIRGDLPKQNNSNQRLLGLSRSYADLLWVPFILVPGFYLVVALGLGYKVNILSFTVFCVLGVTCGIAMAFYVNYYFLGMLKIHSYQSLKSKGLVLTAVSYTHLTLPTILLV